MKKLDPSLSDCSELLCAIVPGISVSPSVVSIEPDRPFRIYCNVTSTQQGSRFSPGGPRGLGGGVLDNTITWTYASTRLVDPDDPIAMQRLMETARQLSSLPKLQFELVIFNPHFELEK